MCRPGAWEITERATMNQDDVGREPTAKDVPAGAFPFGFGGQSLARPFAVGHSVVPGNVNDGVVQAVFEGRTRPFWRIPIGTFDGPPPGCVHHGLLNVGGVFGGNEKVEDKGPPE